MKLYTGPVSLFSAKVRIALEEKGLVYDHVSVAFSREDRYLPHHPTSRRSTRADRYRCWWTETPWSAIRP